MKSQKGNKSIEIKSNTKKRVEGENEKESSRIILIRDATVKKRMRFSDLQTFRRQGIETTVKGSLTVTSLSVQLARLPEVNDVKEIRQRLVGKLALELLLNMLVLARRLHGLRRVSSQLHEDSLQDLRPICHRIC